MRKLALLGLLMCVGLPALVSSVTAQESCRIERVTYRVDGLQLVSWIMKPAREGRFPVVVWTHGAKFAAAAAPIITERTPCLPFVAGRGWMVFFPQTRGYGGSEGPAPEAAFRQNPIAFLEARAADSNASAAWLKSRPDVHAACIANMGFSQGAVTAVLASGRQPALYRATIVDAPVAIWPENDNRFVGMADAIRAARNISGPILVQSNTADQDSYVEVTRVFVREIRRWGRPIEYREYTHPVGHQFFNLAARPEFLQTWGADALSFLDRAFERCSASNP